MTIRENAEQLAETIGEELSTCKNPRQREVLQSILSACADVVLAYRPKPKSKAAKRRKRKAAKK